jgi:hypothetical protein
MAAHNGYKIVRSDTCSFHRGVSWPLGFEQRLPEGTRLRVCDVGFHFCPVAAKCLKSVQWRKGCRLLRVRVPDDALVDVNYDGSVCCASALVAVEDVTDRASELLRYTVQHQEYGWATEYVGIGDDGELCGVIRTPSFRRKWRGPWDHPWNHPSQELTQCDVDGPITEDSCDTIECDSAEWTVALAELDKIESFEAPRIVDDDCDPSV